MTPELYFFVGLNMDTDNEREFLLRVKLVVNLI